MDEELRLRSVRSAFAGRSTVLATIFFFILTLPIIAVDGITDIELHTAIDALRSRGYDLFGNAIETSDLQYELVDRGDSFTFFVPTDSFLYYLDLASQASKYIQTLRFHISPHRLTIIDLRIASMSQTPYLDTLVPNHAFFMAINHTTDLIVDGIRISVPDLYVGPTIAVHGLDGVLTLRTWDSGDNTSLPPKVQDSMEPASSPAQTIQDSLTPSSSPAHMQDVTTPSISPVTNMQDSIPPASFLSPTMQDFISPSGSSAPKMQDLTAPASSPSPPMHGFITPPISPAPTVQDSTKPTSPTTPANVSSRSRKRGKHHHHRIHRKRHRNKVTKEDPKRHAEAVTGLDRGASNSSSLYARV